MGRSLIGLLERDSGEVLPAAFLLGLTSVPLYFATCVLLSLALSQLLSAPLVRTASTEKTLDFRFVRVLSTA